MKKNALFLTGVLAASALAGSLACSGGNPPPPPTPDCAKGTHQEGSKCVSNEPAAAPAAAPAPTAAPAKK